MLARFLFVVALSVLNYVMWQIDKESRNMKKVIFSLILATTMLSGCATLSDTTDSACNSVVLDWLCGDS